MPENHLLQAPYEWVVLAERLQQPLTNKNLFPQTAPGDVVCCLKLPRVDAEIIVGLILQKSEREHHYRILIQTDTHHPLPKIKLDYVGERRLISSIRRVFGLTALDKIIDNDIIEGRRANASTTTHRTPLPNCCLL